MAIRCKLYMSFVTRCASSLVFFESCMIQLSISERGAMTESIFCSMTVSTQNTVYLCTLSHRSCLLTIDEFSYATCLKF